MGRSYKALTIEQRPDERSIGNFINDFEPSLDVYALEQLTKIYWKIWGEWIWN